MAEIGPTHESQWRRAAANPSQWHGESAACSRPSVATSMVIMIGRDRSTAPSMAESSIECQRTQPWLMYSSMITPVLHRGRQTAPESPLPTDTLKCVAGNDQCQQNAGQLVVGHLAIVRERGGYVRALQPA